MQDDRRQPAGQGLRSRPAGRVPRRHRADHRHARACSPAPTSWSSARQIAAVGAALDVPEGTLEIDASGGIVMPGMIDTHRHMWQTAMRGYGADWTLTPVLRLVLPRARQDVPPRGHPRRQPARRRSSRSTRASPPPSTGRTACRPSTTPRPRSTRCRRCPGRFVLAYGNIQAGAVGVDGRPGSSAPSSSAAGSPPTTCSASSWPSTSPATRRSRSRRRSRSPASSALPVTTHAGVWGATNDDGIRLMHEHGFMTAENVYVHAATLTDDSYQRIAATGGSVSVSTESRAERRPGLPADLAGAPARHPGRRCRWTPACGGAATCSPRCATTLGADRSREHLEAHAKRRHRHQPRTCAPSRSSTGRPAAAPRRSAATTSAASRPGKKADVVLIKNDHSPVLFPLLNPYGHVAFQAARRRAHGHRRRPRRQARREARRHRPRAARQAVARPSSSARASSAKRRGRRHASRDEPEPEIENPYKYTEGTAKVKAQE